MRLRQEHPHMVTRPSCSGGGPRRGVVVGPGVPQFRDPPRQSDQTRVTSTAVQAGAESARVMSVTDVSTGHTKSPSGN